MDLGAYPRDRALMIRTPWRKCEFGLDAYSCARRSEPYALTSSAGPSGEARNLISAVPRRVLWKRGDTGGKTVISCASSAVSGR